MFRITVYIFVGLVVGVMSLMLGGLLYKSYQAMDKDFSNYDSENECIVKYISQGVERKDIVRDNGTCYIKTSK